MLFCNICYIISLCIFITSNNINNLSYLSITEFASLAGVAESTLLRFCRKLGLRGYSEFRMLLAQSNASEYTSDVDDYALGIMNSMTSALHSTYELIDRADIEKAVDILGDFVIYPTLFLERDSGERVLLARSFTDLGTVLTRLEKAIEGSSQTDAYRKEASAQDASEGHGHGCGPNGCTL